MVGGEGWWGAMVDGSGVHAHLDGAEIVLQALRRPEMFGQADWLHTYTIAKKEECPGALLCHEFEVVVVGVQDARYISF
jgi:hypothetical protein